MEYFDDLVQDLSHGTCNNTTEHDNKIHEILPIPQKHCIDNSIVETEAILYDKILAQFEINCRVTCFTRVSQTFILGTNIGTILIFDSIDLKLTSILGRKGFSSNLGSVSSLDYYAYLKQNNISTLLVGHARGPITLWDCFNKKCLHICSEVVSEGSSIILARFSSNPNFCCVLDSFGNVFLVQFKNVFGVHSYESFPLKSFFISDLDSCILNFSFFLPPIVTNLDKLGLVAFGTANYVFLSFINHKPRCITKISLCGDTQLLPQMTWNPLKNEFDDVLLAIGYEKTIRLLIIFLDHTRNSIGKREINVFHLFFEIVAINWLGQSVLGILDPGECFHLIDVNLHQELHILDVSHISLIYGSQFFKSYEASGNSHPLFDRASRHACFNSISSLSSNDPLTINFLGLKYILTYYLPDWKTRIDILLREYRIIDALNLAKGFIDGSAGSGVGLSMDIEERKIQIRQTMYSLVLVHSELIFKSLDYSQSNEIDSSRIKLLAKFSIECCLASGLSNEIFGELFEKFNNYSSSCAFIFYEIVSEFIIEDKFPPLHSTFANFLIDVIVTNGHGFMLERLIPHLKVKGDLDIQRIIQISADNHLYGLLIYSYSTLLGEYITPIRILMEILYGNIKTGKEPSRQIESMGYKLLVYLNLCLGSNNKLPKDDAKLIKEQTMSLLLSPEIQGIISPANPYPHLRILLFFNHKDFLNILTISFSDDKMESPTVPQKTVDAFLAVFFANAKNDLIEFVDSHYLSLLIYISNLNIIYESKIKIPFAIFLKMLDSVKHSSTISHFDKEQLLLDLLFSGTIPDQFSKNSMLVWALEGRFYQVCEKIYISRRQYVEVLQCYWNEPLRTPHAFKLIHSALNGNELSPSEKDDIITETIRRILLLVHISAGHSAELAFLFFPDQIDVIVKYHLSESNRLQFEFLYNIINLQSFETSCQSESVHLSIDMQDVYIELLAKFKPQDVLSYLHQTDQFRIEHVLDISKKYCLRESSAFLHERLHQYDDAFIILLNNLKEELLNIPTSVDILLNKLSLVMGLLERTTRSLNEAQKECFWFQLLDSISDTNPEMPQFIQLELVRTLLKSFNAHVSLPALFQKITNENFSNSVVVNDFREMMLNMLNGCTYQVNTLNTVYAVINRDLESNFKSLRCLSNRAVSSKSFKCELCYRLYLTQPKKSANSEDLIVFNCSHISHIDCENDWLLKNGSEFHSYSCPTCNHKARQGFVNITYKSFESLHENKEYCLSTNQRKAFASIKSILFHF